MDVNRYPHGTEGERMTVARPVMVAEKATQQRLESVVLPKAGKIP
jgi:hypothetical protein